MKSGIAGPRSRTRSSSPPASTRLRRPPLLCLSPLLLAACGADSTISGSVNGQEFGEVGSAFYMVSDVSLYELQLVFTTYPEGCGSYTAYFEGGSVPNGSEVANALFIRLLLFDPATEGSYEIVPNDAAYADGVQYGHAWFRTVEDGTWTAPSEAGASSGTLTLGPLDEEALTGDFSVTLSTGDALSGSFHADPCSVSEF